MEELRSEMPEKIKVYGDFVDVFADMMADPRAKPQKVRALGQKLSRIGMKLFVLAPDGVVKRYLFWRALATANEDPEKVIDAYAAALLEMRKDVCQSTDLTVDTAMDLWG